MNKKKIRYQYLASDVIASVIVWILIIIYRKTIYYGYLSKNIELYFPNFDYASTILLFPIACVFVHYLSGYYVNPIKDSKITEFFTTFVSSFIISIVVFFALMIDDIVASYVYFYYSLLVLFTLLFFITYLFRAVLSANIRHSFKSKKMTINTLIIGDGKNAKKIAGDIEKNSIYNTLKGFIQTSAKENEAPDENYLGTLKEVSAVIKKENIHEVIVAMDDSTEDKLFSTINSLLQYNVEVQFTPRLYEMLTGSRIRINKYGINPLVSISKPTMTDWELSMKRFLDILASIFALLLSLPILIYFGIVIKKDSPGSIFYKQERIGLHGKDFYMYKLRTMYVNSEKGRPKLSSPDDSRITPVGRVLRKYRLDEIPQFWNVLKGDMSIVGPRPERRFFIEQIEKEAPYYCLLYKIRPGLTSWGPIKIGYSDTIEKMIERLNYDIMYMENMSLFNDFKILLFTVEIIFNGKGM